MKYQNLKLSAVLLSVIMFFSSCVFPSDSMKTENRETSATTKSVITETVSETEETLPSETTVPKESETPEETTVITSEETTVISPSETTTLPKQSETTKRSEEITKEITTNVTTVATTVATTTEKTTTKPVVKDNTGNMFVHFIDVEQGDSIFIELPNDECMLIDAGESDQADKVVTYIHSQGYDTIDYLVATHPHSDHIGGLPTVINNFNIKKVYMSPATATSNEYDSLLRSVKNSKAVSKSVMAGDIILSDRNLLIEVVAPKAIDNDNLNNNSIVIKLTYGNNKFLFTGDAEKSEEDGIWTNIKCDVLKVGHHGSDGSSSSNFLKKVEPSYAVISCGLHNSYGHPTDAVLKRLDDRNIDVYRTDIQGTIIFTSNGKDISVNVKPTEYTPPVVTTVATTAQTTKPTVSTPSGGGTKYVLNIKTKKIHYEDCSSVDDMKEENKAFTNDYDGAIAQGYKPCGRCKP